MPIPDWSERIKALRKRLRLNQTDFAKRIGVTQSAVSLWEKGSGEPATGHYVLLGNLAGVPECLWFWRRAGLDLSLVDRVNRGR